MKKAGLIAILFLPTLALAAPRTFEELADLITNLINGGIGVALILGIVIYFYGIAINIHKAGESHQSELSKHLLWGMIALFVMFSVWGILALLRNTLFTGTGIGSGGSDTTEVLCDRLEDCMIED